MEIYLKTAVFTLGRAFAFHVVLPAWYALHVLSLAVKTNEWKE